MNNFKKWFAVRARNPEKITLEEAFEAGARSQPTPSVPAGWKLVPIEPTPEMLASAWGIDACDIAGTYAAMLAAAPEAK